MISFHTRAEGINFGLIQIVRQDNIQQLNGDIQFNLSRHVEEALSKGGINLHFVAEFEIKRNRWYWLDQIVVKEKQILRLSYNPLSKSYRIQSGNSNLAQFFPTLDLAVRYMSHLSNWAIDWQNTLLKPNQMYESSLRIYLDKSELPRTFQLNSIANPDWNIDSNLYRWQITTNYDWTINPK